MSRPRWFWVMSLLALVWNLLGVMAFTNQMMMTPEMLALMSQPEQDLFNATPVWVNTAFAGGVFGGALGSVFLLMKKAWAVPLFLLSFISVAMQMSYAFFMSHSFEVFGPGGMIMPIMVLAIAFALIMFSIKAKKAGWVA